MEAIRRKGEAVRYEIQGAKSEVGAMSDETQGRDASGGARMQLKTAFFQVCFRCDSRSDLLDLRPHNLMIRSAVDEEQ
jgi:hypothetical protein